VSSKVRSIQREAKRDQPQANIRATLGELLMSQTPLSVLFGQQMPIGVSFKLGKIAKAVNSEMEHYNATKKTLCERYANKDEQGQPIILDKDGNRVTEGQSGEYDFPKGAMVEVEKEHTELLKTDVVIPGEQLKISDLANVTMAPAHLMSLSWLITD
jgi:hypothetical protein